MKKFCLFTVSLIFIAVLSFLCLGKEETQVYRVKFYTGDYKVRQEQAMADGAMCYVEQHFNSTDNSEKNYTLVLVTDNANEMSRPWGEYYTERVSEEFGIVKGKDNGISVIKDGDRGYGNMKYLKIPAILLEPFYISNPEGLEWAKTRQDELAQILVESIYRFFPEGGLIAFSVGHKYKTSRPDDAGAQPFEGIKEIEFNEKVLEKAARILDPQCILLSETYFPVLYEEICSMVENNFYNKDFIDKEFKAIKERYNEKVKECREKSDFDVIIRDMLKELNSSHTAYYTVYDREYYQLSGIFQQTEEIKGLFNDKEILYPSAGIFTEEIDGKVFILSVLEGGAGEKAGLLKGDEIVSVDGSPFLPIKSFLDKEEVKMEIKRSQAEETLEVTLAPESINPSEEFLRAEKESIKIFEAEGKKIGYIHIWCFAGDEYYEEFLDAIQGDLKDADSLIFDLRDGWGGASPEYLNVFNKAIPQVDMIKRDGTVNTYNPQWKKPVVMLVNERTRSGKEVLAYGFKKYNRGKVMGEKTAGAVLGGKIFVTSDKSLLYLGVAGARIDGENLEGTGVEPDIKIPFDIKYCRGQDIQIEKAMDYLTAMARGVTTNDEAIYSF